MTIKKGIKNYGGVMENSQKQIKYNAKKVLEDYMPNLIKLLGNQNISWNDINKGLQNHLANIREEIDVSNDSKVHKHTTFYSFITGHISGKQETVAEFNCFNQLFSTLYERLSKDELKHLHKMIKPVLTNFDYNFRNFIGELATLNAYKSTGKYTLLNIEEKVYSQNNVSADLYLKRNEDNKDFLVEIVNIHLEQQEISNFDKLKCYLKSKIDKKIKETFFKSPKCDIYIQPVVWVKDIEQIKLVSEFYKRNILNIENVFIPMTYLTYSIDNNSFEHRFEYVTTILDDNIQISNPLNTLNRRWWQWKTNKINSK
ncbi:MAG TPA: hypothetical protein PK649_03070 [Vicingus sp.]|nr:hypothetical protein [Vicingus sp.]HRP58928.1 hypothetical protein [Vicingus sp.]